MTTPRVLATPDAQALVERLRAAHGEVFFYLSHGCCDGSTPMLLAPGEMTLSANDRRLGWVAGVPFHASAAQCEYLQAMQLTLDVAPGDNGSFSLEDGSGQHFVLQLRLFSDEELARVAPVQLLDPLAT